MTDGLAKDRWLFWLCIALSVALHGGLAAYLTTDAAVARTDSEAVMKQIKLSGWTIEPHTPIKSAYAANCL